MSDLRNAAEQALSALLESVDLVQNDYDTDWQHRSPSRAAQMNGKRKMLEAHTDAITALRAALAQQVPLEPDIAKIVNDNLWNLYVEEPAEPVAWRTFDGEGSYDYRSYEDNEDYIYQYIKRNGGKYASWVEPLYTAPPHRKPLTKEEIERVCTPLGFAMLNFPEVARAIERAHGIGEKE